MLAFASAIRARITSRLVTNIPTCDADSDVRAITSDLGSKQASLAAPSAARARSQSAPARSSEADDSNDDAAVDDDFDCQVEAAGMCDCGPPLSDAQVKVGASVAVPFSLGGHPVHFEGTISSMPSSSEINVAFPGERPWLVARDRLFAVVALGEGADTAH